MKTLSSRATLGCLLLAASILLPSLNLIANTYYSGAATGDPTLLTAWWSGTGGTGSHPIDFASGDTFIIQNGQNYTMAAGETWTVSGGATVQINSGGTLTWNLATSTSRLNLGGNLVQNGTLAGSGTSATGVLDFTSGSWTWTGSGDMSGVKLQVYIDAGATLNASGLSSGFKLKSSNTVGFNNLNGVLNLGTLTINGNANTTAIFTLGASGTLITATTSTSGLPGIFTGFSSGKITLPTTANYTFNGTAAQVTGTTANNATMPATVNSLTFSNAAGVMLSQATTVNGTLSFLAGRVSGNVTLGSSGIVSGGSGSAYLNGQLTVSFVTPTAASFLFPIGTTNAYSPIGLTNFTDTGTATLTASATATQAPNQGSSGIDNLLYIARYWTLTAGSGFNSPSYNFTGTYVAADNPNGANTNSLIVQKYDGTSWASPASSACAGYSVTGTGFTTNFGQFAAGQAQTTIPIVSATTKAAITNTGATLGATLINNYSLAITDYGIVWGTSLNPTTNNSKVQIGTTTPTVGSPFTASVTGLPAATTIYYRGYALSASGLGYSTNDSFLTLANEPTTQATGAGGSSLQNGNLTFSWTRGNGAKCIALVNASSAVNSDPVDGTTYTANAAFGSGTQIGTGNYVVYLGTGTSVTLTGLSSSTTYYVAVYELNGSGGSENYLTVAPATGSLTTVATPVSTITWTGTADTDWNNANNWDALLVPGVGTGVVIPSSPANQPVYANPMVAASIGGLTNAGTLNIGTNGFNSGAVLLLRPDGSAQMNVTPGAVVNISGNLGLCSNGLASMAVGSSVTISGGLNIGSDLAGGNSGTATASSFGSFTNWGGTLSAGSTSLNPRNASIATSCRLIIAGGTNNLGAVTIQRAPGGNSAPPALGTDGLVISNGVVNMAGISLGNNAHGVIYLTGGFVTNKGTFAIQNTTATRPARFVQTGGVFVNTNTVTMSGTADTVYAAMGGTNSVAGFVLSGTTILLTNNNNMYIGSAGISGSSSSITAVLNPNGALGATADWTNAVPLLLNGGSFSCQDANGTPHNIYSSGILAGGGALTKTGNGTLTLNAAENYSGSTLINAGTLVLGASGALSTSGKLYIGSGATFDVSAVTGGFVIANQTLTGMGVITGAVTVASSASYAIDPGSNALTGTLSFSNSVTETGGAINHFDLAGAPNPNNDLVVIAADFNVTGTNTMDIGALSLQVGSVYPLVKYGGNFNGSITNFIITSAVGILSNSSTAKIISFIPQATLRGATNVVWIGNSMNTNWDTEVSTNWLNAGALDYFVPKDNVQFTDGGASNSPVNLVGTVTPTSIVVNSHSNYVFASTSGGGIGDSTTPASLTVTNTGTLTILTTNIYTGITTIDGGGALAVAQVANINSPSAVGESDALVINNGTFIYSGPNASVNRGATLGSAASAINVSANGSLTLSGLLGGAGGLTKTGPGNLILPSGNSYNGGTFVNAGTLSLNSVSAAGSGAITLNGGTLALGAVKPANTIIVASRSVITGGNAGGLTGIKAVTGSGDLLLAVTATTGVFDLTGDMSTFSGGITFSNAGGGAVRLNGSVGSPLATFDLGTGSMDLNVRTSSTSNNIGALAGGSSTTLSGRGGSGNSGATTYYIGANGRSTVFGGIIQDGNGASGTTPSTNSPASINKLGLGILTLTGASTHSGATTVSSGTLEVDGSLGSSSSVTINGGTLAGGGVIGGPTTLNAGAILSPGSNSVGTLTFSGNLTLNAASTNNFAVTTTGGVSNSAAVAGTLSPNGSVISITSGTALAAGTYTLFTYGSGNGTAFTATPVFDVAPAAGASIVDTGSGQINLVVGSGLNAGYLTNSISGSTLNLTWPAGQNWRLVSQTNSLSTGLNPSSAAWSTVTGVSDGSATITIDPTQPTVFYELVNP